MMHSLRIACFILLLRESAAAQTPNAQPQFEAASMKLAGPESRFSMNWTRGRIDFRKINLKGIVYVAYSELTSFQFAWPESLVGRLRDYDVSATFPAGASDEEVRRMLQGLLTDRLKLASHWETRDMPVYALVVAKGGLRVERSSNPPGPDALSISHSLSTKGWSLNDHLPDSAPSAPHGITIGKLTQYFNNNGVFDRMLVDESGLAGYFAINMFIPADPPDPAARLLDQAEKAPSMPSADKVRDALRSQLGLTVQERKAPVRVLVIDRIDPVPVAN